MDDEIQTEDTAPETTVIDEIRFFFEEKMVFAIIHRWAANRRGRHDLNIKLGIPEQIVGVDCAEIIPDRLFDKWPRGMPQCGICGMAEYHCFCHDVDDGLRRRKAWANGTS